MKNDSPITLAPNRPFVEGKFLKVGDEKFYIKGVTYGTFRPDEQGFQFPPPEVIRQDFSLMASQGINAVRTYTVPPHYLFDIAQENGLKVMVGLPWEQHIAFLDSAVSIAGIIQRTQESVRCCQRHPAILCYAIGNEIPATIVRWYGGRRIEKFLHRLYRAVKAVDPQGLVTYVNYPTTEYLRLPFLDFDCFNVYLETPEKLEAYLARLHNLFGDRPLVLAEIGLDSMRNGVEKQARTLDWQIRTIFGRGCAGAFVFAWTDEWWRGGFDIEDWDFGIVTRDRRPKPALANVAAAFRETPFSPGNGWPKFSVVVCTYNGSATIRDTLEALRKVDYPNFEVIVVNDGSTDTTAEIVAAYPFQLINIPNGGLSNARNTGLRKASGEIVAYIDDDAYPDPQWLHYLAYAYLNSDHAGIGGPNIPPPDDGPIAGCVANAPGGPVHVLTSDDIAEHIPGCNMSFRRDVLLEINGFDPLYRAAGDDVDVCWRIQNTGRTIGFHPAAVVWHHRRNSIRAYWRQQKGYGKAEALLEMKWPERYNGLGHLAWSGRIYGAGLTNPIKLRKEKIFHGTWGSALFQSVYEPAPNLVTSIPLMPEWLLLIGFLGLLSLVGFTWTPLFFTWPLFVFSLLIVIVQAAISASKARFAKPPATRYHQFKFWALTTLLHLLQPVARLCGRLKHGLTPWRRRTPGLAAWRIIFSSDQTQTHWSETWRSTEDWLEDIELFFTGSGIRSRRGGHFDRWDLQASRGLFSSARGVLVVEEHGGGKQFLKFHTWPSVNPIVLVVIGVLTCLTILAAYDEALVATLVLGSCSTVFFVKLLADAAGSLALLTDGFRELARPAARGEAASSNVAENVPLEAVSVEE